MSTWWWWWWGCVCLCASSGPQLIRGQHPAVYSRRAGGPEPGAQLLRPRKSSSPGRLDEGQRTALLQPPGNHTNMENTYKSSEKLQCKLLVDWTPRPCTKQFELCSTSTRSDINVSVSCSEDQVLLLLILTSKKTSDDAFVRIHTWSSIVT